MPRMPRGLLEQVHEHPPQVDPHLAVRPPAHVIKARRRGDHRVDTCPGRPVEVHRCDERVVRLHRVIRERDVETGETVEDPHGLRPCHVFHQPEQRRAAPNERSSDRVLVDAGHLADEGFPLILEERVECLPLACREPRRLLIGHERILRSAPAGLRTRSTRPPSGTGSPTRYRAPPVREADKEMRVAARHGADFLERLRTTARDLWVGGERVVDVTTHPSLQGAARTVAGVFDRQHEYRARLPDRQIPRHGEAINISHMMPRSRRRPAATGTRGLSRLSEGDCRVSWAARPTT